MSQQSSRRPGAGEPGAIPAEPPVRVRLLAELLGTLSLTFVAAGADAAARVTGGAVSDAARAIAPALLVAAFIYSQGDRSGAHFNPAISLAFMARGVFPARLVPAYVAAQLAGATLAALLIRLLLGDAITAGVNRPKTVTSLEALGLEVVLTWLLAMVALGTAHRHRVIGPQAAIAVGATIALCGLVALPLEGASMNPARSTGPALVAANVADLWIYWLGPVFGAVLAVITTNVVHGRASADTDERTAASGGGP